MGGVLLFLMAVGAGIVVLWLGFMLIQALLGVFIALLGIIAAIFTGKWLWDFFTSEDHDQKDKPRPPE